MVKTGQNYKMMFLLIGSSYKCLSIHRKLEWSHSLTILRLKLRESKRWACHSAVLSSEVVFENGQNTEEENIELENSIKIQKGKICYVFYIPVLFQISMK